MKSILRTVQTRSEAQLLHARPEIEIANGGTHVQNTVRPSSEVEINVKGGGTHEINTVRPSSEIEMRGKDGGTHAKYSETVIRD